ncbi:hypothetical protein ACP70R_018826 [Stipagrostis hirtigluma subsp. patula]
MEVTALSVGKSVLKGTLGYAKSAIAQEVALQLGVQRDQAFIRDELEMMLSFLMAAHEERDKHMVITTWVKQVRDVAYDVEDCLLDFAVRLEKPSWWHIPRTLLDRRRVAKQMKELRAKVEDVSQRNVRYGIIKGSGSKVDNAADKPTMAGATTIFGIEEARWQQEKAKLDLVQLISRKNEDLTVIAVWGTSAALRETSIIKRAFDDPRMCNKFECRAWMKLMHPFNPTEFLQVLQRMRKMKPDNLAQEFKGYVDDKSYLIVLTDLSAAEEWDQIISCLPNNRKGSRIIVCTEHVEVASLLCFGQESGVLEHKQLSADQTLYAFIEEGSEDGTDLTEPGSSSIAAATSSNNTDNTLDRKSLTRVESMVAAFKESQLIGRGNEKSDIIKLISNEDSQQLEVISICGMGGLGKTALVKDVFQSQELSGMFQKRACLTITRPFNLEEILRSLAMQLDAEDFGLIGSKTEHGVQQLLAGLFEGKKYLIVLDDLSSTMEWDTVIQHFPTTTTASRIIVTTRVEKIAKYCSKKHENIYKLEALGYKDACDLFTEKVFGKITDLDDQYPELVEEAKLILRKCNGLPLAIVTIGGFLANQQKTPMEWRKLNEHISAELEMNPEIGMIRTVLLKSYDGLPYHLKSCFLYLSIFPEDHSISRKRLVRRWTAEGYSSEVRGKSAEEIADSYFMELIDRSMILPFKASFGSTKGIDSCQVHDLIREISISKSMEENLVFRMEEGCVSNTQGTIRHLVVSSNWEGDQSEFESTVDLSRVRSLTVFGKWRPFFISDKMMSLRVLDLEGTSDLADCHLEQIGKFLHLKYLSLRGSNAISYLPDSIGDLRQLETLDIRETNIVMLPKTIIKLRKLRHLHAGRKLTYVQEPEYLEKCLNLPCFRLFFCVSCCTPQIFGIDGFNRRDACTHACCAALPGFTLGLNGVSVIPRGTRKLKALETLRVVHLAWGNAVLQEIKRLTQLRKLGVVGINKKNGPEFCSTISNLRRLESLSVQSDGEEGLYECLDGMSSPPKNLQSLKLSGVLVKLPEWVGKLQNLVKLKLRGTRLLDLDAAVQVLGSLPNLAILRLWWNSFQGGELHFQSGAFRSLMVLELWELWGTELVKFDNGATPKLELLRIRYYSGISVTSFFGLEFLPSVKEVRLNICFIPNLTDPYMDAITTGVDWEAKIKEDLRMQLAKNPNQPILKVE